MTHGVINEFLSDKKSSDTNLENLKNVTNPGMAWKEGGPSDRKPYLVALTYFNWLHKEYYSRITKVSP